MSGTKLGKRSYVYSVTISLIVNDPLPIISNADLNQCKRQFSATLSRTSSSDEKRDLERCIKLLEQASLYRVSLQKAINSISDGNYTTEFTFSCNDPHELQEFLDSLS